MRLYAVWWWLGPGVFAGALALHLLAYAGRTARDYVRHVRTRNVPPRPWQRWRDRRGVELTVLPSSNAGWVVVTTATYVGEHRLPGSYATWGSDLETWQAQVRQRRMYLLPPSRSS